MQVWQIPMVQEENSIRLGERRGARSVPAVRHDDTIVGILVRTPGRDLLDRFISDRPCVEFALNDDA